jgi:LysW-gamma-L-lysine carboxypeptidase
MPVDLLQTLVSIYSPSGEETEAVQALVNWMREHGFVAYIDEVGNAVGIRGRATAPHTLLLLGHIDTVPGKIAVRVEDGCLYGRGSVDAKGSLCAFAEATALAGIPDDWRVMVVGAVEEEISTSKGAHHIRQSLQPDMCIIGEPSGAGRITLGYKGRLLADITVQQSLAHTARDEPSAGALGADIWQTIHQDCAAINAERPQLFDRVLCRLQAFNTASDGFTESARLTVGFRLPPDYPPTAIQARIQTLLPSGTEVRFYGMENAYRAEKNTPLVRALLRALRTQGYQPAFVMKTGTSDMNVVGAVWDCPIVAYGPGDSNLDHTPHEHLDLAEYQQAVAVLTHFIICLGQ